MRNLVTMALVLGLLLPSGCAGQSGFLVIRNVTVIDGTGTAPQAQMTVLIEQNRIKAVGAEGTLSYPSSARIIDGTGKYVIPGLWDMHVHLRDLDGTLPLFIINGVTSVRDMGSDLDKTVAMRERVDTGTLVGPQIKTSGMMVESPSWLEQYVSNMREHGQDQEAIDEFLHTRITVGSPREAREAIDSLVSRGADFIKIRHVESPEVFTAISKAAADAGTHLAGHYVWKISLEQSANDGQRSVEHNVFPGFDERSPAEKRAMFDALLRNDTYIVPTLVTNRMESLQLEEVMALVHDAEGAADPRNRYVSRSIRESWIKTVALDATDEGRPAPEVIEQMFESSNRFLYEARKSGVKFLAGTDCPTRGTFLGFSLHEELELLVKTYDMSPMEALRSATALPAKFMGMEDEAGTLEAGKRADLVLLDADPIADVANTRRIDTVIANGRVFEKATREKLLHEIETLIDSEVPSVSSTGQ